MDEGKMSREDWVGRISDDGKSVVLVNQYLENGDDLYVNARVLEDGQLEIYRHRLWRGSEGIEDSESWTRVASEDIPRAVQALGGQQGDEIITLLARRWTHSANFEINEKFERAGINVEFHCWP